jgi:phosphate transport system substrate-binding protein
MPHMSRRPVIAGSLILVASLAGGGAALAQSEAPMDYPAPTCVDGTIIAGGSTALQPLVDAAGAMYTEACPNSTITVQGGGSGTGLTQVAAGAFQIGNSDVTAESKLPAEDAAKLVDHQVAKQGWIMVVNPDVTGVTDLTTEQATAIWTGTTTNWKDVGGPDEAIVLVLRPESSGTRATFKSIVLGGAEEASSGDVLQEDSNGAVVEAVGTTPGSTSVIGFAYYQDNKDRVTGLSLDGVEATVANMADGSYKLSAVGHMYTNGEPADLTASFLDYMMSPAIQEGLIPSMNYAPVTGAAMASPEASTAP